MYNLVPRAHVPFDQHQDTRALGVLVLTKRHMGSGNEIDILSELLIVLKG